MDRTEIRWESVDWVHVVRDGEEGVSSCEFGNDTLGSKTYLLTYLLTHNMEQSPY
jgi:hypothetical protein